MPRGIYDRSKSKSRPPMSEAHKKIVSATHKGKTLSKKTRDKISHSCKGNCTGSANYRWKGGKRKHPAGYMRIITRNHPFAKDGYMLEHRAVMEKHIGRYLKPEEVVHHINGIRTDNSIKNLILFNSNSEHRTHHRGPRKNKTRARCSQ